MENAFLQSAQDITAGDRSGELGEWFGSWLHYNWDHNEITLNLRVKFDSANSPTHNSCNIVRRTLLQDVMVGRGYADDKTILKWIPENLDQWFSHDFIVMNLMNFANDDVNGPYQYSMDKNDGF